MTLIKQRNGGLIEISGALGGSFPFNNGVRQGNLLSGILFVISMKPLADELDRKLE